MLILQQRANSHLYKKGTTWWVDVNWGHVECLCPLYIPNQACWSPWTSMAKPKSASFTAAFLHLLARSKFSGYSVAEERHNITNSSRERQKKHLNLQRDKCWADKITCIQTQGDAGYAHTQKRTTDMIVTALSALLLCRSLQRFGEACTIHLCGPDKTLSLIIHCQKMVLIMGLALAPPHSVPVHLNLTSTASIMASRRGLEDWKEISEVSYFFTPQLLILIQPLTHRFGKKILILLYCEISLMCAQIRSHINLQYYALKCA